MWNLRFTAHVRIHKSVRVIRHALYITDVHLRIKSGAGSEREVISPNDRYTEVEAKVAEWLAAGTRMVIVVNPRRRSVRVHRSPTDVDDLVEGDAIEGGEVVPGWSMPVSGLF